MIAARALIATELGESQPTAIVTMARMLAERMGGDAVLFYGSTLRTGDMNGVQDFYVLQSDRPRGGFVSARLWPDISFHEIRIGAQVIRAKVATMPLEVFRRSASGAMLDTTIWTRFVQSSALVFARNAAIRAEVVDAVTVAALTAGAFAALHGPPSADPVDHWKALFQATYETEIRFEAAGRQNQILGYNPARYRRLLPLLWREAGIAFDRDGDRLTPRLDTEQVQTLTEAWMMRQRVGPWLNAARLIKAAFTFDGASSYALWKIERHTGVRLALTPWRERHPILSAPGVLWRVWLAKAAR